MNICWPEIKQRVNLSLLLLGLNAGFGNSDCANLPIKAIDYKKAVIEFPQPQNGINCVVPSWTETHNALKQAIKNRTEPAEKEFENLVFLTVFGEPWVRYHISQAGDGNVKTISRADAVLHIMPTSLGHLVV